MATWLKELGRFVDAWQTIAEAVKASFADRQGYPFGPTVEVSADDLRARYREVAKKYREAAIIPSMHPELTEGPIGMPYSPTDRLVRHADALDWIADRVKDGTYRLTLSEVWALWDHPLGQLGGCILPRGPLTGCVQN